MLDVPRLISWLSSRQYAPEGGFSGRTNKLVDGCYSHWVGACWPLIQASLGGGAGGEGGGEGTPQAAQGAGPQHEAASEFLSFYDREGLIRYIMSCGQDHSARGGMRDKPSQ